MPTTLASLTAEQRALVDACGADEAPLHATGGRLVFGGVTASYFAGVRSGLRLRVLAASLPVAAVKGMKVTPLASKANLSVTVTTVAQAQRLAPYLRKIAVAAAKPVKPQAASS